MVSRQYVNYTILAVVLVLASFVGAQEVTAVGANSIEVTDGVHLFTGLACNAVALTGPDGVLLIDSGSAANLEQLKDTIDELRAGRVRIAINTHFHFDHIGANEQLSKDGVIIVAHERARRNMLAEWRMPENPLGITFPVVPAYPETALPMLTFADALTVHFGAHEIEIRYLPGAHSDADAAVFLRDINVLHTGDLYLSNGFPIIDSFHGGTINGLIAAVDALIDLIDDDTIVVPGHGTVSNLQELRDYRYMLSAARDRIAALVEDGKSLEETVAADPTAGLFGRGESWLPPQLFVWTVYADLVRSQ